MGALIRVFVASALFGIVMFALFAVSSDVDALRDAYDKGFEDGKKDSNK